MPKLTAAALTAEPPSPAGLSLPLTHQDILSHRVADFRQRLFPGVSEARWNDWRWQIAHRLRTRDELAQVVRLTADEERALAFAGQRLTLAATPYYASLIDPYGPADPIRRAVVPRSAELTVAPGEAVDPLGEEHDSPVPGLVHRYPDRVLLLATGFCSTTCRYCTRARAVGASQQAAEPARLQAALEYIRQHPEIRDVLVSGGDPLTMPDAVIEGLLSGLRAIKHVEIVRLGTKVPMVLPMRITPALTRMLKRYHPLFVSIHAMHPAELTPAARQACERLADAGIPLGSQTVLLEGVNADVPTMKQLFTGLLSCRVRPYYLYHCDQVAGTSHFRTPVVRGLEIIRGLRGHISGYAIPHYVVDLPGGGGKTPLVPGYLSGGDEHGLTFTNFEGSHYHVQDIAPAAALAAAGMGTLEICQ